MNIGNQSHSFVLVHGAFHGGWCWARVADRLRGEGHRVFTPTQTGMGERAHLLSETVSIETWISDIVSILECEELWNVVLVGHSFGGVPIAGVADRIPERIRDLVFLDALLVPSGRSALDAFPAGESRRRKRLMSGRLTLAPYPASDFGIMAPSDIEWVERRMTPHPTRTYSDSVHLNHQFGNGLPCTYIACTSPPYPGGAKSQEWAKSQPGWRWIEVGCPHDAMVVAPDVVATTLLSVAKWSAEVDRPVGPGVPQT